MTLRINSLCMTVPFLSQVQLEEIAAQIEKAINENGQMQPLHIQLMSLLYQVQSEIVTR